MNANKARTTMEELITELRGWHVLAGSIHIANAERRAALGVMLERQQQLIDRAIGELGDATPGTVWLVSEEEPDHDEFPSVIVGVYDNEQAAQDHVIAERDAHGLADEDEYQDADISWLVEKHELRSTSSVVVVDRHVRGES
jgi:hypothetical protein